MEPVSMNDGLDVRETVAFGLAAGEVAVFLLTLLTAYAVIRSGLAGALAWGIALVLAGAGAGLAWGRFAGRPLLEWAVLLARFAVRAVRAAELGAHTRAWAGRAHHAMATARTRACTRGRRTRLEPASPRPMLLALRPHADDHATPSRAGTPHLAVVPDANTAGLPAAAGRVPALAGGMAVATIFSLRGGSGRTTLAD